MKFIRRFFPYLLIVLVVGIAFGHTLPYEFISDDIPGIVQSGPLWTWMSVFTDSRFLTRWTGMLQFFTYQIVGQSPWAYRIQNILFHIACGFLLFLIAKEVVPKRIAFIATMLFSVHPVVVESVVWISGGVYVQYSWFFLISLYLYMTARSTPKRLSMVGSIIFYIISLFFSEKAAVLFLLIASYEWMWYGKKAKWGNMIPYLIVSIISIGWYGLMIPGRISSVSIGNGAPPDLYNSFLQIPIAIGTYIKLTFAPVALTLYQDVSSIPSVDRFLRIGLAVVYFFVCIITLLKQKKIAFFLLWFIIPLIPTLTPLKIAWLVAERYVYLSLFGLILYIVYLFDSMYKTIGGRLSASSILHGKRHMILVYSVVWTVVGMGLCVRTVVRTADWQSQDTLWLATAKTSPFVPYSWNNMGDVYSRHGDLKNAAKSFSRAIELNPQYADAYHNLGLTYKDMGEMGDAKLMLEKAASLQPRLWQSYAVLAEIACKQQEYQICLQYVDKALAIVPTNGNLLEVKKQLQQYIH